MKIYIKVPIEELQKLEKARVDLYKYLFKDDKDKNRPELHLYTEQIWKIANTLKWD